MRNAVDVEFYISDPVYLLSVEVWEQGTLFGCLFDPESVISASNVLYVTFPRICNIFTSLARSKGPKPTLRLHTPHYFFADFDGECYLDRVESLPRHIEFGLVICSPSSSIVIDSWILGVKMLLSDALSVLIASTQSII